MMINETYIKFLFIVCVSITGTFLPSNPALKQLVNNPCAVNNGGCSELCLLSSQSSLGYNCSCRQGYILDESGVNCERE